MAKKRIILQALIVLAVVWGLVVGVRALAGSKRITADKIEREVASMSLEDWSEGVPEGEDPSAREARVREIAEMFNRLDFGERQKAHQRRVGDQFFDRMSPGEKDLFVDLTIEKSMETFMDALDAMTPRERKKIVEDGLRQIEEGRTADDIARFRKDNEEALSKITDEGLKAYFEKANADTKLDLAPLMQEMDGLLKGFTRKDFRPD
ncbi:MAG: hypothetical protein MUF31_09715 [Akkermansiaceae bacterium]|jgi:hypothetical protein|nr:hypothetical protein [Akkermansiaceae bacterium]